MELVFNFTRTIIYRDEAKVKIWNYSTKKGGGI